MAATLCLLMLSGCYSNVPTKPEILEMRETGPDNRCIPGEEGQCRCRIFDGTKFLDGYNDMPCGEDSRCPKCIYF